MNFKSPFAVLGLFSCFVAAQFNGISFSGVNTDGSCPSQNEVSEHIQTLHKYTETIRIYSLTHCNQGEYVLKAINGTAVKVYLGLSVDSNDDNYSIERDELVRLSRNHSFIEHVSGVIVGSGSLKRGDQTAEQIINKVKEVKGLLKYNHLSSIPVTVAETPDFYSEQLVGSIDFIFPSIIPFLEGIQVNRAGEYVFLTIEKLKIRFNETSVVIGETGWPTSGSPVKKAVPSIENSMVYMEEIAKIAKLQAVSFIWLEGADQQWKVGDYNNDYEGHWGVLESDDKTPKYSTLEMLKHANTKSLAFGNSEMKGPTVEGVLKIASETPWLYSWGTLTKLSVLYNENPSQPIFSTCKAATTNNSPIESKNTLSSDSNTTHKTHSTKPQDSKKLTSDLTVSSHGSTKITGTTVAIIQEYQSEDEYPTTPTTPTATYPSYPSYPQNTIETSPTPNPSKTDPTATPIPNPPAPQKPPKTNYTPSVPGAELGTSPTITTQNPNNSSIPTIADPNYTDSILYAVPGPPVSEKSAKTVYITLTTCVEFGMFPAFDHPTNSSLDATFI